MKRLAILLLFAITEPNQRAILTEFSDFLAIPNLASDAPNIARNAAAIRAMFEKRGVTTRLLTLDNAPPIVVVDVPGRDAWILCDGPVHQSRRMQLVFGARGVVDAELTVYGPVKGLHDGHYGNWVPNPIIRLTHLIDSMCDETGRILIAHFYDDVKPSSAAEQEAIAKMPPVEADLKREFGIAATESDNLNESLMRPALNVRGIQSGHIGAQASNTIQTEATASLDFRLVPAETPESIKKLVEQHIESQRYTIVRTTPDAATRLAHPKIAKLTWGSGYPPARTPLDLPLAQQIATLM